MSKAGDYRLDALLDSIDVYGFERAGEYESLDPSSVIDDFAEGAEKEKEEALLAPQEKDLPCLPNSIGDLALALSNHHAKFSNANCKKVNSTDDTKETFIDFAPGRGEPTNPAKLICNTCPRQDDCLRFAMDNNEKLRIWGGASTRERINIKRAYKKKVDAGLIDPDVISVGEFAVENRALYITPARLDGPTSSYKPPEPKIEEAGCLEKHSSIFEEIDGADAENITKEKIALAIIACRICPLYKSCRVDPVSLPVDSLPSVVGGQIQGKLPRRILPTEKYIDSLIPLSLWPEWEKVRQTQAQSNRQTAA